MSDLHVLVFGSIGKGVCDRVRFGSYVDLLAERGVQLRAWDRYGLSVPDGFVDRPEAALEAGVATLDRSELDWADVLVFRRWYQTTWACAGCDAEPGDRDRLVAHCATAGHELASPEWLVRPLFDMIERDPQILRGRAIVYETDDDLLAPDPANGLARRMAVERDLIERMMRRADLVTVATPALAEVAGAFNDTVRLVRNAINPSWYALPSGSPPPPGHPHLLYYGAPLRLRDLSLARHGIESVKRAHPGAVFTWMGAAHDPVAARIADRVRPQVEGIEEFAAALAAERPDIGLAPVLEERINRARSELHWLEYSMAGAATVASRTSPPGPYDVIRDGIDGLLAETPAAWDRQLRRLGDSRDLRAQLAGAARERVLAEYDVRGRADEWADSYRWAAVHAGRGAARRFYPSMDLRPARELLETESRATLDHRQRRRLIVETAPFLLQALRKGRDVCWPETDQEPLVTVLIAVVDEPPVSVVQAVRSALTQTYSQLEVLVVAAGAREAALEAVRQLDDARIRIERCSIPEGVEIDLPVERDAARAVGANHGLLVARGSWIAPLDPGAEFTPDHVAVLLEVAVEHRLEFVYGQASVEMADGESSVVGAWPPLPGGVLAGSEIVAAALSSMQFDPEAWRDGESPSWDRCKRLVLAGVRMANVEQVVTIVRSAGGEPAAIDPGSAARQASRADYSHVDLGAYLPVLRRIHQSLRPNTYLEIGVETGASMRLALPTTIKVGVDPDPQLLHPMDPATTTVLRGTSDEFFADGDPLRWFGGRRIDMAFIDGMHLFEYVLRDFINVERLCHPGSLIVLHDCKPIDAITAGRERLTDVWMGDTWKIVPILQRYRPDLRVVIVDVEPSGLALVTRLDPASSTLIDHFDEATAAFMDAPLPASNASSGGESGAVPGRWADVRRHLPSRFS